MKIFCIGRNYAKHIQELNNERPEQPVVFMKPPTALLKNNSPLYLPDFSEDIHFEAELVFRIGKHGKHIEPKFALRYVDAFTIGIDFTARDIQQTLKSKGLPWELAKGFDGSAAIGQWLPMEAWTDSLTFSLEKNGEKVQEGQPTHMLFTLPQIIAYLSKHFTLQKGDLLYTGTPEGVGPVKQGDQLEGFINQEKLFSFAIR